jgi:nucleotide-binding universal stress UspA family protein
MFNRILLPLDRSALAECVLPHAIAIARAFESQVTLLHVMDTPREARWRRAMDPLNWQIHKAEATTYLHGVDLRLQAAGLPTETHILEGAAAEQKKRFSISVTGATYHC